MSDNSSIEWTDATWNPVVGCARVSPGCDRCYAIREANRHQRTHAYGGTVHRTPDGLDWTGRVRCLSERLGQPQRWRAPRRVFVNSMSDLFHDGVPDAFIAEVFAVMALAQQHQFQVLTKRHGRMRSLLASDVFQEAVTAALQPRQAGFARELLVWPLPNVWVGVSVEDQHWADIRIPALLGTPAAVRWISAEPLLGPIALAAGWLSQLRAARPGLDWVVVGGESGPGARPMHPQWVRALRDQCTAAGVPYLLKQWGEHVVEDQAPDDITLPGTPRR